MVYEQGAHLRVRRKWGYSHHGIHVGHNLVVHFNVGPGSLKGQTATVRVDSLGDFANGGAVEVVEYANPDEANIVLQRAQTRLDDTGYDVFQNNCEHFAVWCKTGRHQSKQSTTVRAVAGVVGMAAPVAAGVVAYLKMKPATCTANLKTGKRCTNPPLGRRYGTDGGGVLVDVVRRLEIGLSKISFIRCRRTSCTSSLGQRATCVVATYATFGTAMTGRRGVVESSGDSRPSDATRGGDGGECFGGTTPDVGGAQATAARPPTASARSRTVPVRRR